MAEVTDQLEATLAHHGVKGMKWGVRRDLKKLAPSDRGAYLKGKDEKWLKKVQADPRLAKVSKLANREARRGTRQLKKDYRKRGMHPKRNRLHRIRYDAELTEVLQHSIDRAAYKVHKNSPTGLYQMEMHRHPDGSLSASVGVRENRKINKQMGKLKRHDDKVAKKAAKAPTNGKKPQSKLGKAVDTAFDVALGASIVDDLLHRDVMHADDRPLDLEGFTFYLTVDEDGFADIPDDALDHDALGVDMFDETLAHYGVRGMKWGVRKRRESSSQPLEPEAVQIRKNNKGGLVTSGGGGHKPSEDALKAVAYRQKARASGTHSLSNSELKALVDRMNLEGNYAKLVAANAPQKSNVHKFIDKFIEGEKNMLLSGKKTKTQGLVENMIQFNKGRKARQTTTVIRAAQKSLT